MSTSFTGSVVEQSDKGRVFKPKLQTSERQDSYDTSDGKTGWSLPGKFHVYDLCFFECLASIFLRNSRLKQQRCPTKTKPISDSSVKVAGNFSTNARAKVSNGGSIQSLGLQTSFDDKATTDLTQQGLLIQPSSILRKSLFTNIAVAAANRTMSGGDPYDNNAATNQYRLSHKYSASQFISATRRIGLPAINLQKPLAIVAGQGVVRKQADTPTKDDNLKQFGEILQTKIDSFYKILLDEVSLLHTRMLKYFEQERRVLVLDAGQCTALTSVNKPGGLMFIEPNFNRISIVCICTKLDQVESLRRDSQTGRLRRDLEDRLCTKETLDAIEALGIRIEVNVSREEMELAENELKAV